MICILYNKIAVFITQQGLSNMYDNRQLTYYTLIHRSFSWETSLERQLLREERPLLTRRLLNELEWKLGIVAWASQIVLV